MSYWKVLLEKWKAFICNKRRKRKNGLFYIGGSDTLPPPLSAEEEQQAVREIQNVQTKESSRAAFLDDLQARGSVGAEGQSRAVIWREESDVPQSAAAALEAYREQGAGKLMCSGYMDIKGNVWGGIVMSRTWVDIIYVTSTEDGAASTLRIVRLSAENVG